jgi:small nuclear ribonucleoprotein (snRNP)-like protein
MFNPHSYQYYPFHIIVLIALNGGKKLIEKLFKIDNHLNIHLYSGQSLIKGSTLQIDILFTIEHEEYSRKPGKTW